MPRNPGARGALRRGDLALGQLGRDLVAQASGLLATAHGGDVEPLVPGHHVGRHRSRIARLDGKPPAEFKDSESAPLFGTRRGEGCAMNYEIMVKQVDAHPRREGCRRRLPAPWPAPCTWVRTSVSATRTPPFAPGARSNSVLSPGRIGRFTDIGPTIRNKFGPTCFTC